MIFSCIDCGGMPLEGRTTRCASCNTRIRREERQSVKDSLKAKPKKIKPMSEKMKVDRKLYSGKGGTREQHLKEHPGCQIKILGICTGIATTVHHSAKRGKNLNEKETFLSACFDCHEFVETRMSAQERREKGFLK